MIGLSHWKIALVSVVTGLLIRGAIRHRGWGRAIYIVLAAATLLGGTWFYLLQADQRIQNQENAAAGAAASAVPSIPDIQPDGLVRWHGRVTLTPSGLSLDQIPPKPGRAGRADIRLSGPDQVQGAVYGGQVNIASWGGSRAGAPDQLACLLRLSTAQRTRVTVRPGSTVCLQTASGLVATLTFTTVPAHGPGTATATVWTGQEARS